MNDSDQSALELFVDTVVSNLEKNGYPQRRVAFPIERMYESADAKGVNFNKVLDALAARGITHEKTPERIIFEAEVAEQPAPANPFAALGDLDPNLIASLAGGLDPSLLAGLSGGLDPRALAALADDPRMAGVAQMLRSITPEQMAMIRGMIEKLTPEQVASMLERFRKLGLG